jgi:hypothetical protein
MAVSAVLFMAPMGLTARSCIIFSAPAQKACKPGSCANKTCCATSSEHKSTPSHPLMKAGSSYEVNTISGALAVTVPSIPEIGNQKFLLSNTSVGGYSSPTLAVLCSFLI